MDIELSNSIDRQSILRPDPIPDPDSLIPSFILNVSMNSRGR